MRWRVLLMVLGLALLAGADLLAVAIRPMKKDPVKEALKQLEGTWVVVSYVQDGRPLAADTFKNMTRTIAGNRWTTTMNGVTSQYTFQIDPTKNPRSVDITPTGTGAAGAFPCIYEVDGDTLKLCQPQAGKPRPTKFTSEVGSGVILTVAKREKAK